MARQKERHIEGQAPRPPLGIEFDGTGTAIYIRVSAKPTESTRQIEPGLLADSDSEGALVGFEVIGLEKRRLGKVLALIREKFSGEAPNLEQLALIA